MRIIGGKYKGRRFAVPRNFSARPTTDFARENIFNVLNNTFEFEGLHVLDLFSGTGAIALEFASRGAEKITLVEKNSHHYRFIQNVKEKLGEDRLFPVKMDVFNFIKQTADKFDIIFADPPYDMDCLDKIPGMIFEYELLNPEGWLIFEHSAQYSFKSMKGFKTMRKYGSVHFSIFENV